MKTTILILIIALGFSFLGVAQKTQDVRDSLVKEISEIHKQGFINGFSVGIVSKDSVLFTEGFGYSDAKNKTPYTEGTIQNIASISKTVIGVALLKAQELGKLKLDDPINKYLPFDITNPNHPNTKITIRHLATHTSSILDGRKYWSHAYVLKSPRSESSGRKSKGHNGSKEYMPLPEFLMEVLSRDGKWYSKKNFSKNKPGSIFEYSNIGAALAAYVIEIATEQPFPEFTKTHIFGPLRMNNTGWSFETIDLTKHSKLYSKPYKEIALYRILSYPDGGLRTTASDLCMFLKELMKGYKEEGTLLANESYKELFREQLDDQNFHYRDKEGPYNDEYNSGIFMGFSAKGYIGHTGSDPGVSSYMFFSTSTLRGRILIVNTTVDEKSINEFSDIWHKLKEYESKL